MSSPFIICGYFNARLYQGHPRHHVTTQYQSISIEKPHKKRRGPPQFHNCQSYGHTLNNCHHEPRCVKCGENYSFYECSKDHHSPAKCAVCTKDHTTNFKGRPVVYKAPFKKTVPRVSPTSDPGSNYHSNTKSYAEATKNQNSHMDHTWSTKLPTLFQV